MSEIYARFEYKPQSTRVDSPIDVALEARRGVCQDFAHIFIALMRPLGIPTRYVSGYLFRDLAASDRPAEGASHAWAESFVPGLGWVGFDPTNNLVVEDQHIRVAVGRDYADVPPTRGVYKGATAVRNELAVAVRVGPVTSPLVGDALPFTPWMSREAGAPISDPDAAASQQQDSSSSRRFAPWCEELAHGQCDALALVGARSHRHLVGIAPTSRRGLHRRTVPYILRVSR